MAIRTSFLPLEYRRVGGRRLTSFLNSAVSYRLLRQVSCLLVATCTLYPCGFVNGYPLAISAVLISNDI